MMTVLIIDDDRAMRLDLGARLLNQSCAIRSLGHNADLTDTQNGSIDVLVVNLASSASDQQRTIDRLFDRIVFARAIVIVTDMDTAGPRRAMDRGAYVLRTHAEVAEQIASLIIGRPASVPGAGTRVSKAAVIGRLWGVGTLEVSARELQIIEGVKNGHTNRHIATDMGTSEQQVKNILSRLYRRYRIKNRVSLINMIRTHDPAL